MFGASSVTDSVEEFFGDEDHPALNIDPEEHQPDEEHTDEAAKERQQRFRDEWE